MKLEIASRHFLAGLCGGAALAFSFAAHAQTPRQHVAQATELRNIAAAFKSPPNGARPMIRWWWFGPAVTKPELAHELEQMKQGGFGGFEIQPVYPLALDDPQTRFHNFPFLSPEFLDDVRYVNQQAHTLGLRASLTLGSGWPYGGPHTPVTEASCQLKLVTTPLSASSESAAVPFLENGESLIAVFDVNSDWQTDANGPQPKMLVLPAAGATRMTLPAGAPREGHELLWFISSRTGQQVKRAGFGAEGFVLDHFSHKAVAHHLKDVAEPELAAFGDQPPDSVFSDSLEVYAADWTPELPQEFLQIRGYDLIPHLPELLTHAPSERAMEFRHDWGVTLTQLIDKNYLEQINAWALAHHTRFRSQSYGFPAVSLSSNALVSLIEGEGPQWQQFSFTRWATSASHVYGHEITSSETWTWLHSPPFRATPLDMKAEADCFFLQGINQLMGHGWPYSPPSAGEPGWNFYAAGAFNAHNPWWIVMPDVMGYMQRVSWALRQGQPDNDVAIYLPEDDAWAKFAPGRASITVLMPRWITPELTQTIEDSGHNFDYIDAAAIAARGIHYPVLIMPNVDRISPATLELIQKYAAQGGKVIAIGRIPTHAPGYENNAQETAKVAAEAKALFSSGGSHENARLVRDVDALASALNANVPPDMHLAQAEPQVGFIHRKLEGADLYFIANTGNQPVSTQATFRNARSTAEWLDPDTGAIKHAAMNGGAVQFNLAPYESRILLLHDGAAIGAPEIAEAGGEGKVLADLSPGWRVRFNGNGVEESMPNLVSWTENPKTEYYSGVATYTKTFDLTAKPAAGLPMLLSFGQGTPITNPPRHMGMQALIDPPIQVAAVVYVNGERAGSLWHPPYQLNVGALVKQGSNTIEVRVANTAINERAGQALPDYRLLWSEYGRRFEPQDMNHLEPLPSGLLGKVQLISGRTR
ncbi:MAG TPA: glycosyl hydrolase [Terracidiphilus sp.]|nr:glycosyl hydrolase [Terracidiphilus sp.]